MEATLYNMQGEKAGKVVLPESIFGLPWNADLVHQVVTSMQDNARTPVAHTKDRGEVRGGGKKPWKQKGTGRARHGSSRSPIWKGGGVTHGPRNEKDYSRKVSRKMRQKALLVALSRKMQDGELIFLDSLEMKAPKASEAKAVLVALGREFAGLSKTKNAALVVLPGAHAATQKSFGNFGNIAIDDVRNLNPVTVLKAKYLVIANPKAAIETLGKKQVVKEAK
jgi:large subunit ribosomal protein L4